MKADETKINNEIIKNYVNTINSIKEPMNKIKDQLSLLQNSTEAIIRCLEPVFEIINKNIAVYSSFSKLSEQLEHSELVWNKLSNVVDMSKVLDKQLELFPNSRAKIFCDVIERIMDANNGMLSTRMIEPLNISRQYLSMMEKNNIIEKVSRGIYVSMSTFEDSYFSFQQKYKKAIFSHMNALYFYGMTEEFPDDYTVTVPQNYHVDTVNEKCNVFYVSDDIYEIGITEVETPSGNKVRAYDKERCICDIIRSKGRMDPEQVKKSIKKYIQSKDKNVAKLSSYAKRMGISKKVIEMVGIYYE